MYGSHDSLPHRNGPADNTGDLQRRTKQSGLFHGVTNMGLSRIPPHGPDQAANLPVGPMHVEAAEMLNVISHKLHRRHLTESQRAMVAAKLAKLEHGQRQSGKFSGVPTQAQAAELLPHRPEKGANLHPSECLRAKRKFAQWYHIEGAGRFRSGHNAGRIQ